MVDINITNMVMSQYSSLLVTMPNIIVSIKLTIPSSGATAASQAAMVIEPLAMARAPTGANVPIMGAKNIRYSILPALPKGLLDNINSVNVHMKNPTRSARAVPANCAI